MLFKYQKDTTWEYQAIQLEWVKDNRWLDFTYGSISFDWGHTGEYGVFLIERRCYVMVCPD